MTHPTKQHQRNFDDNARHSRSAIQRLFVRSFGSVLLLVFVAGMLSNASLLHPVTSMEDDSHPHHSKCFTKTTAILIVRQGIISLIWSLVNWMPIMPEHLRLGLQKKCWHALEEPDSSFFFGNNKNTIMPFSRDSKDESSYHLDIPRIAIQDLYASYQDCTKDTHREVETFPQFVSNYLIQTYGADWREQPLLLKGILDYNSISRENQHSKRLSLQGLLELDQVIPYFEQANRPGALTPTAEAPVSLIVQGMLNGRPYKIGSQLLVQEHPEWMRELTGMEDSTTTSTGNLLTYLFGNHFSPKHVLPGRLLPATTTVPVFVAHIAKNHNGTLPKNDQDHSSAKVCKQDEESCQDQHSDDSSKLPNSQHITTGLHCEPIGNVAFQIEGSKEWTLVSPKYSAWLQPSLAADGRAFFASSLAANGTLSQVLSQRHIPHWTAVTGPSDALWVPTWTWHRVDYRLSEVLESDQCSPQTDDGSHSHGKVSNTCVNGDAANNQSYELAIGGSIFHFRPLDFLRRNPLYAILIVPALIKELAGISTQ